MIKKILISVAVMAVGFANCTVQNTQKFQGISKQEIDSCVTPQSVACNYLLVSNDEKLRSLVTSEFYDELFDLALKSQCSTISKCLREGFRSKFTDEIAITESHVTDTDKVFGMYGEKSPYSGLPAYSVTFYGADSQGNIYDGHNNPKYQRTRILLVKKNGKWQVFMVK
ncbi:MAG: hypothetical protein LBS69_08625 [Prevotellaceae bacterium]|jgi:hypothetical protein|nr:hypothetical protein [Prevotellaceae bacterium]